MGVEKIGLETDNIFKLILLHRVLHKSKFQKDLHDLYSQFGAEWSNKVLDEIIDYYQRTGNSQEVKTWQKWRLLTKNCLEYPVILNRLLHTQDYLKEHNITLTHEEKMQDILMVTSPFILSDELLNELLQELTPPYP